MKSTIILLTYNASGQQCKIVNEKIHEKIDSKEFIHKIYVECAKQFYANPELFWHQYPSIELKRNQQACFDIINKSMSIAIKQSIPMNDIIEEYLKNDYIIETEEEKIQRLRNMINGNAEEKLNYFDENDKKVLITEYSEEIINENVNGEIEEEINDEISKNIFDIDKLINNNTVQSEVVQSQVKDQAQAQDQNMDDRTSDNDFADRLAKVDLYSKSNRNSRVVQPIKVEQKIVQQDNLEQSIKSDNIEIIKNKPQLDERGYFNSMFNA